ncbi:E3 ubiquitin ligase BIG BROTHER [Triticum urartu]|uniref:E3 ubiquitin ligase BIG BROTHER n=1 Tax=Triticum urartu TaxID=4572 RepID=M7YT62_TRIUA|nr:E3 ubiquitin ligase BIG BROTHER [Triticum urartu]
MAAPNTYAVHLSSETHKIEAWCESDEALAKQLQEEEDSLATREFAGSVSLEPSSPAVEYRPANNAAQVATEDNVDPDNMSYEQLQAIGEEVGTQSRGLSDDLISYLEPFRNKCNFFSCKKNTDEYVTVSFTLNRSSFCNPMMNNNRVIPPCRCVICKSNYKSLQKLIRLPCSHCYHANCITRWLKINKACPVCNEEVFG